MPTVIFSPLAAAAAARTTNGLRERRAVAVHGRTADAWGATTDAARDERYPVDGGVFDVPPGRSEVIVPVHASRHVSRVAAFSVTVEQPGGAVVSARDKVVAFARGGT